MLLKPIIYSISFFTCIYLGVFVYLKDPKSSLNKIFHLFIIIIGIRALGNFGYYISNDLNIKFFFLILITIWPLILFFQYFFIINFTENIKKYFYKVLTGIFLVISISIIIKFIISVSGQFSFQDINFFQNTIQGMINKLLFFLWPILIGIFSTFISIDYLIKQKDNKKYKQSLFIFLGIIISFISSFLLEGLLPVLFNIHFEELSLIALLVSAFLTSYAILKYELFDINSELAPENIINIIPDTLFILDPDLNIIKANKATYSLTGYNENELLNKNITIIWDNSYFEIENFAKQIKTSLIHNRKFYIITKSNEKLLISISSSPILNFQKKIIGYIFLLRNHKEFMKLMKEKEELQDQLFQSQKLDSLGQLAGGIAHDFNNFIGAIYLIAEDMLDEFGDIHPGLNDSLNHILAASNQVKDLTNKLLAFARKGKYEIKNISFHGVIEETIEILSRTFDKKINIFKRLNAKNFKVKGDFRQLQNALFNIALNARDAMINGGDLIFQTEDVHYSMIDNIAQDDVLKSDYYLKISIIDSGIGMSKEVLEKIFEPFFTKKELGEGTGLGLASVYGIIKNHNGIINITSEENKGTNFTFYLPLTDESELLFYEEESKLIKGKGNILLIDDEELVRNSCKKALNSLGYTVNVCNNGFDALKYYKSNFKKIDIILLDLVMPKLSGSECFFKLKKINPDLKVIIMTGYTKDGEATKLLDNGAIGFIHKPFTKKNLNTTIIDTLD